jgi:hypothetical protein
MTARWVKYGKPFNDFVGEKLNKPGTLVETNTGQFLIGHINTIRGVCDDCEAFDHYATVIRYKTVWRSSKAEDKRRRFDN